MEGLNARTTKWSFRITSMFFEISSRSGRMDFMRTMVDLIHVRASLHDAAIGYDKGISEANNEIPTRHFVQHDFFNYQLSYHTVILNKHVFRLPGA